MKKINSSWQKYILSFCKQKLVPYLKKYAENYTELVRTQNLSSLTRRQKKLLKCLPDLPDMACYETSYRTFIVFMTDFLDIVCNSCNQTFYRLLRNYLDKDWILDNSKASNVQDVDEKFLSDIKCYRTLYIDSLLSKLNERGVHRSMCDQLMNKFLSQKSCADQIKRLCDQYSKLNNNKDYCVKLGKLFNDYMETNEWQLILGENQILSERFNKVSCI